MEDADGDALNQHSYLDMFRIYSSCRNLSVTSVNCSRPRVFMTHENVDLGYMSQLKVLVSCNDRVHTVMSMRVWWDMQGI